MKTIAIIPARGGSKRIPRKNAKPFMGKPIIAYSIEAALASGVFDEVMVSTDDDEIARIARECGAKVPFMRSERTSTDFATTADVLDEVLDRYAAMGNDFDALACIYATAPFITAQRLMDAAKMIGDDFDSAFTVVAYSYPVQRSLAIDPATGTIAMRWPEYARSRSQDLAPLYHDAGQFYFAKTDVYKAAGSLWCGRTAPIILSELEVQDLDTPTDWALAELKYQLLNGKKA